MMTKPLPSKPITGLRVLHTIADGWVIADLHDDEGSFTILSRFSSLREARQELATLTQAFTKADVTWLESCAIRVDGPR